MAARDDVMPQWARALERANAVRHEKRLERERMRALRRVDPTPFLPSEDLRRRALERANEIRWARAALKRRIAAGEVPLLAVLRNPPDCALRMRVADLLLAQHGWGPKRTAALLRRVFIRADGLLVGLDGRQWKALKNALREIESERR